MAIPGIADLINWNLIYEEDFQAIPLTTPPGKKQQYLPIPEIIPTLQLFQPIIAVNIATLVPSGQDWRFAGYMNRFAATGVGSAYLGNQVALFLGKFNVIQFQDLQVNYNVRLKVPKWFTVASVAIYEFYPP